MKSVKRSVPTPPPVSSDGIRYEVDFDGRHQGLAQTGGVISAVKEDGGAMVWSIVVYPITVNPAKEQDTQEVFITDMTLDPSGKTLNVTNEAGDHFAIDLVRRTVSPR